jgi:hypothetical protein
MLVDSLNALFPKYNFETKTGSVTISENDEKAKVKEIKFLHDEFISIEPTIVKDFSSFFQKAGSPNFFNQDSDGIIIFEWKNQKYIFIIEMKSKFDTKEIFKARQQIVSSYIKLYTILNMISDYEKDKYICRGIIVCLEPNEDKLNWLYRSNQLPDTNPEKKMHIFASKLVFLRHTIITKEMCTDVVKYKLSCQCMFDQLTFSFIGVAENSSCEVSVRELLCKSAI